MFTDCFNRIFDCPIRVCWSFCKLGGKAQQIFGRAWALPDVLFGYTTVWNHCISCFTCFSYFSFRLSLFYACTESIILELFLPKLWPIILKLCRHIRRKPSKSPHSLHQNWIQFYCHSLQAHLISIHPQGIKC